MSNVTGYEKLKTTLKYMLVGKGYHKALKALTLGETYHTNIRKDGSTPEYQHQIEIALYLTTIYGSLSERQQETLIILALLHDLIEDYDGTIRLVDMHNISTQFSEEVNVALRVLSKIDMHGEKISNDRYYNFMLNEHGNPLTIIVKCADRINNLNSMTGVFSPEKQLQYVQEVEQYFLPMIKETRKRYPEYADILHNIKFILTSISKLVRAMHE